MNPRSRPTPSDIHRHRLSVLPYPPCNVYFIKHFNILLTITKQITLYIRTAIEPRTTSSADNFAEVPLVSLALRCAAIVARC